LLNSLIYCSRHIFFQASLIQALYIWLSEHPKSSCCVMDFELYSGEFTGYYTYDGLNDMDHEMHCSLVFFEDGRVVGHGVDDVNPFHFEGKVDISNKIISLTKKYPSHHVTYTGSLVTANNCISISGTWKIDGESATTGVFTLKKGHTRSSIMVDIDNIEQTLKHQLTTMREREL